MALVPDKQSDPAATALVPRPSSVDTLGATAGLSSSAENTVGQANRGTRHFTSVEALGPGELLDQAATTRLDALVSWCRKHSLWPMPFATACCGIELMATGASRHDIARFGAEVFRFSPRQCDLMIVAGRVVMKMLPVLERIWQQMPEPKWCISMGACASTGGVFDTYAVVQGVDRFIPVDLYVPGCPPRPEQLIQAVVDLQAKIQREGTLWGKEFDAPERQQLPRALRE